MAITPIYNPAPDDPTADTLYQAGNKINNNEAFLDAKIDDEITNRTNAVALKADIASPAFTGNPTAPTPSAGDNDTSIATTEFVQDEIVSHAQIGKNLLINGDFSVIRDSTSITTTVGFQYTLARWLGHTQNTTVSQQEFTVGQTDVDGSPVYYIRNVSPAVLAYYVIKQRIEDVRRFSNRTVTLSYWMRADTPFVNQNAIVLNFGAGGSADDVVYLPDESVTTSWQRFTHTFTVPSISGKTIGSGNFLEVPTLRAYQGSNTVEVANAQLEFGTQATDFEMVDPATQLARCQRYYEIVSRHIEGDINTSITNNHLTCGYQFAVEKRATPNIKITDQVGNLDRLTTWAYVISTNNQTVTAPTWVSDKRGGIVYQVQTCGAIDFSVIADAEIY